MKNIVLIENAALPFSEGLCMAERVRRENRPDFLTVIGEGDFRADGSPTEYSAKERAAGWMEAGADLVLQLPVFSILGGYGKKDFAAAALMQRLHSVDRVILPCRPLPGQTVQECGAMLRKCAMLMFREHPDYRKRLQENLRGRTSFLKAQMEAVIFCIPEAEELLRFPENRQSVCMLDAMLQLYYIVQTEFMAVDKFPGRADADTMTGRTAVGAMPGQAAADTMPGRTAADCLPGPAVSMAEDGGKRMEFLADRLPEPAVGMAGMRRPEQTGRALAEEWKRALEHQSRDSLMNISGSTEKAVSRILSLSGEIEEKEYFEEIVELMEDVFPNTDMARLFLLRILLNIRHSDMLISGLHTYVPYCLVSEQRAEKPDEIRRIEETAWVPFVRAGDLEPDTPSVRTERAGDPSVCGSGLEQTTGNRPEGQADETLGILLEIEQRAKSLLEMNELFLS